MRKIILSATLVAATLLSTNGHAFTQAQHKVLNIAKQEGMEAQFPETIQAIALQESLAGAIGRHGDKHFKDWKKRSYGVMQVRFTTAKWILHRKFGSHIYTDAGLLHNLTYNDKFNIFVARIYWQYLYNQFRGQPMRWTKAVLSYNAGIGNVIKHGLSLDPNNYVKNIHKRIKSLRRHKAHGFKDRIKISKPSYRSPSGF
jgi:hypothetical protein